MKTDSLHGDVIAGMSAYHHLDHQLATADTEVPEYRPGWPAHDLASWSAGDDDELTGDQVDRLLQFVQRPDADVQREVLRALRLESLVPLTLDAQVADGIVTLTGTVGGEHEGEDAKQVAGCVPGVLGILTTLSASPGRAPVRRPTRRLPARLRAPESPTWPS
jgi:hypothetical protein